MQKLCTFASAIFFAMPQVMKKKVKLSSYSLVLSGLSFIVFCMLFVNALRRDAPLWMIWSLGIAIFILCFMALCYSPLSLSVDDRAISVHRLFKTKHISLSDIADVKLCPPTMAAHRIVGSGGWFGYYGWFSERDLGKYFAYYGKASDCFLVTLRDGRKYMLGCDDAPAMVEAIKDKMK